MLKKKSWMKATYRLVKYQCVTSLVNDSSFMRGQLIETNSFYINISRLVIELYFWYVYTLKNLFIRARHSNIRFT